jgi:hypothetical protein
MCSLSWPRRAQTPERHVTVVSKKFLTQSCTALSYRGYVLSKQPAEVLNVSQLLNSAHSEKTSQPQAVFTFTQKYIVRYDGILADAKYADCARTCVTFAA